MDLMYKTLIGFGCLLSILGFKTAYAASYCCPSKPIRYGCSPSTMKIRQYVDVGLGESFKNHMKIKNIFSLYTLKNNNLSVKLNPLQYSLTQKIFLETGFSWSPHALPSTCFFPLASLGLRYQHSNLNDKNTLTTGKFIETKQSSSDKNLEENDFFLNNSHLNKVEEKMTASNPETNFSFPSSHYTISRDSFMAITKFNLFRWHACMPYISGGAGLTWQRIKQKEPFLLLTSMEMHTKKETANKFTYSLGAGLDFLLSESFSLSLGYDYEHFGNISFRPMLVNFSDPKSNYEKLAKINKEMKLFKFTKISTQSLQLTGRFLFG